MKHRPGKVRSLPPLPTTTLTPPEIRLVHSVKCAASGGILIKHSPHSGRERPDDYRVADLRPLRKMLTIAGSSITIEHILAADRLRQAEDAVAIGFSGPRELVTIQSLAYRPKTCPGQAALRSARA
jgi:hypothetical protein